MPRWMERPGPSSSRSMNTIFVGFDVNQGAKGAKWGNVGAVVATLSQQFTTYFSTTTAFHTNNGVRINEAQVTDKYYSNVEY